MYKKIGHDQLRSPNISKITLSTEGSLKQQEVIRWPIYNVQKIFAGCFLFHIPPYLFWVYIILAQLLIQNNFDSKAFDQCNK